MQSRKRQVACHMLVRLALMPRTRCRANQLLVNLALQKALNAEVHNAKKKKKKKMSKQSKDILTDSQRGYVLSMFLQFWKISASNVLTKKGSYKRKRVTILH